jgi:hypothetical protein
VLVQTTVAAWQNTADAAQSAITNNVRRLNFIELRGSKPNLISSHGFAICGIHEASVIPSALIALVVAYRLPIDRYLQSTNLNVPQPEKIIFCKLFRRKTALVDCPDQCGTFQTINSERLMTTIDISKQVVNKSDARNFGRGYGIQHHC